MTVGENEPSSLLLVISWVIAWHQLEGVGCPGGMPGKELPANTGDVRDVGLIPGSGISIRVVYIECVCVCTHTQSFSRI